ncbi:MAG: DUF7159 family protein, partial [Mycobacterium sp.]
MDFVLGVSMAPTAIRMVLVEGENADGVTVEEDSFDIAADEAAPGAADQVISAILGTREGAAEGGCRLASTGVTCTDPADAVTLRDALAARKVNNVMLVSALLSAAALAQTVGNAIGYEYIALLYVEPGTATLAVVDSGDGSIADVHRRPLSSTDVAVELAAMVAGLDGLKARPEGVFIVGSGVDVAPIKPALEAAIWLPVSAPEEPDMALARGAALASANTPLLASSTAALAYAKDPGTGEVNPFAVAPGYFEVAVDHSGPDELAYSAVPDEDVDADTAAIRAADDAGDARQARRPLLLVGTALAALAAASAVATVLTLAVNIRQTVALLPMPGQHFVVPTEQAPAPPPAAQVAAPQPPAVQLPAPAAPPAPADAVAPPPAVDLPAPAAPPLPAPAPAPVPAAPAPVPVPVPVQVPIPVLRVQAPVLQPPVNLPIPQPPAQTPAPPIHLPTPPAQAPTPPVHIPTPPAQTPTPPVHIPTPPAQTPTPP